jgi:hypothetical protein
MWQRPVRGRQGCQSQIYLLQPYAHVSKHAHFSFINVEAKLMATLRKAPGQHPTKPAHQFQFVLYFLLVALCILITAVSTMLITTHI